MNVLILAVNNQRVITALYQHIVYIYVGPRTTIRSTGFLKLQVCDMKRELENFDRGN